MNVVPPPPATAAPPGRLRRWLACDAIDAARRLPAAGPYVNVCVPVFADPGPRAVIALMTRPEVPALPDGVRELGRSQVDSGGAATC